LNKLFKLISPSNLGCMFMALILGMLLIAVPKDLLPFFIGEPAVVPADGAQQTTSPASEPNPIAATPTPPREFVILGTDADNRECYFDWPSGIFCREEPEGDPTFIAKLGKFDRFEWSPKRDKIAFLRSDVQHPYIYVLDLKDPPFDSTVPLVTEQTSDGFPAGFSLRIDTPIAWAPSGDYIAFVAYDAQDRAALFVTSVDSPETWRLTEGDAPVVSVGWETEKVRGEKTERVIYAIQRDGEEYLYSVEPSGAYNKLWR
jgi:hypothetical protein